MFYDNLLSKRNYIIKQYLQLLKTKTRNLVEQFINDSTFVINDNFTSYKSHQLSICKFTNENLIAENSPTAK